MKRSGPLKRGKPLKRGEPLRRKPGSGLKRTAMKKKPPKPRPEEGPMTPLEYKRAVFRRANGRCAVTGKHVGLFDGEAHHPLPKRWLRSNRYFSRVWDPDNGVWVSQRVHERHETGSSRITRDLLPASVWRFAETIGPAAILMIERFHPEPEQEEDADAGRT